MRRSPLHLAGRARPAAGRATVAVALVALLGGCSAPVRPELPAAPPASATAPVPSDGVTLRMIGVGNGPVDAFSLPRTVVVSTRIDEPNGVTVVTSSPSAVDIADYLRRALPASGFSISAEQVRQSTPPTAALTFAGHGWSGSFTGTGASSAVLLRPA